MASGALGPETPMRVGRAGAGLGRPGGPGRRCAPWEVDRSGAGCELRECAAEITARPSDRWSFLWKN